MGLLLYYITNLPLWNFNDNKADERKWKQMKAYAQFTINVNFVHFSRSGTSTKMDFNDNVLIRIEI